MTEFEKKQPAFSFMRGGRLAFLIGCLPSANPFKNDEIECRAHRAWDKGYAAAQLQYRKQEAPRPQQVPARRSSEQRAISSVGYMKRRMDRPRFKRVLASEAVA